MTDVETLKAYATKADDYAKLVSRSEPDADLRAFIGGVPKGAHVLDLGCGPGNSAAMMAAAGLKADAMDASLEMVQIAQAQVGINATLATFDDLNAVARYDGIWANFSLLHAPRADMPRHLDAIHRALKPGGLLHIGLKTGTGEERDDLGRLYIYYTESQLRGLLDHAGFTVAHVRHDAMRGLVRTTPEPFMIVTAHA